MLALRIAFTAIAVFLVVWSLRSGYPLAGLVFVPLMAALIRRAAESGQLTRRFRRNAA